MGGNYRWHYHKLEDRWKVNVHEPKENDRNRQSDWSKSERWNIDQVSVWTGLSIDDLEAGKGPEVCEKKGGQILFLRSVVEAWLNKQHSENKQANERSEVDEL